MKENTFENKRVTKTPDLTRLVTFNVSNIREPEAIQFTSTFYNFTEIRS